MNSSRRAEGQGAWLNGQPIRVSGTDRLERALVATGFPYDIRERVPETLARLGRMMASAQGVRRGGSAALDMCYVACGRFDGFYEENLKPWDTAAGLPHRHRGRGEDHHFRRRRPMISMPPIFWRAMGCCIRGWQRLSKNKD